MEKVIADAVVNERHLGGQKIEAQAAQHDDVDANTGIDGQGRVPQCDHLAYINKQKQLALCVGRGKSF